MTDKEKKEFIDPTLVATVSIFSAKAIAQAIIGWIGLEAFKLYWRKIKNKFRGKNVRSNIEGIPGAKPQENP